MQRVKPIFHLGIFRAIEEKSNDVGQYIGQHMNISLFVFGTYALA